MRANVIIGLIAYAASTVASVAVAGSAMADAAPEISRLALRLADVESSNIGIRIHDFKAGRIEDVVSSQRDDGSWPGIDYKNLSRGNWPPAVEHLEKRVLALAAAYHRSHDPVLAAAVKRGLDWWVETRLSCPNWWWNDIGAPQSVGLAAVLILPTLADEDRMRYAGYLSRSKIGMTGQNRIWLARIVMMRGIVAGDESLVDSAVRVFNEELCISQGPEGLASDWSFRQHGPQLQLGNYGLAFAVDMSRLAHILSTTRWEFPREKLELLGNFLERGLRWTVWRGRMDVSALGRQLQPGKAKSKADAVALSIAECEAVGWRFPEKSPTGFRFFPKGAYAIWRTEDWMASVKMHTHDILETETWINNENTQGGHLADGALFMRATGREYEDIFPLWRNWRLVPGVTSYRELPPVSRPHSHSSGANELNEMTAEEVSGGAIVDFGLCREGLSVHKRWRFTADGVEATGTGISSTRTDSPVVTCVEHCLAATNACVLSRDGNGVRFVNGDFEYTIFAPPESVSVVIEEREGDWGLMHPNLAGVVRKGRVLCATIDHGVAPASASYHYCIKRCPQGRQDTLK